MGWVPALRGGRRAASIGIAICLITAGFAVTAVPASAASTWQLVVSPTTGGVPLGSFAGTNCFGTTLCFAVGSYTFDNQTQQALAKKWNGTAWSVTPVPSPAGATSTSLAAVKCLNATSCFAVGRYLLGATPKTLVERWNGSVWTPMTVASPPGAADVHLNGVTCATTTNCFAVGSYDTSSAELTLIERWTGGSAWAGMTAPNGAGASASSLNVVACGSATNCFAVGQFSAAGNQKTFAIHWTGSTTWAATTTVNPSTFTEFSGVACTAINNCLAVGEYSTSSADKTLAEKWNGTKWATVVSANAAGSFSVLDGVTCASATVCFAAGESVTTNEHTLAEKWNGSSFVAVASSSATGSTDNSLTGVACGSTTVCFAVGGSAGNAAFGLNPLVLKWNGTSWPVITTPNPSATSFGSMNGVGCVPTTTQCFGVGNSQSGFATHTMINSWDGATWTAQTTPNAPASTGNSLAGVACLDSLNCFAVGHYNTTTAEKPLTLKWNGTTLLWSVVLPPIPSGATQTDLNSVACPTATFCLAAGSFTNSSGTKTFTEKWNGSAWAILASVNPAGSVSAQFHGIACISDTDCFAVGDYDNGTIVRSVIENWNGTAWAVVSPASPNPSGAVFTSLAGVTCPDSANCFATGSFTNGTGTHSLNERWSAGTWALQGSVNPAGSADVSFRSIMCPGITNCYAVGRYSTATGDRVLTEEWSGTTWSIDPNTAPPGTTGAALNGVICDTTTTCIGVGSNQQTANRRGLAEKFA